MNGITPESGRPKAKVWFWVIFVLAVVVAFVVGYWLALAGVGTGIFGVRQATVAPGEAAPTINPFEGVQNPFENVKFNPFR